MSAAVLIPLSKRTEKQHAAPAKPGGRCKEQHMTAVTPEIVSEQTAEPRPGTLARLASLLVQIRTAAGEDLQATVARAIDNAFAGIHREMR